MIYGGVLTAPVISQFDEWLLHEKVEQQGNRNDYQPIKTISPSTHTMKDSGEILVDDLYDQKIGQEHRVRQHAQMGNRLSDNGRIRLDSAQEREPQGNGYGRDSQ